MKARINAEVELDQSELESLFRKHMLEQVERAEAKLDDDLAIKRGQIKHLEAEVANLKATRRALLDELSGMRGEMRKGK